MEKTAVLTPSRRKTMPFSNPTYAPLETSVGPASDMKFHHEEYLICIYYIIYIYVYIYVYIWTNEPPNYHQNGWFNFIKELFLHQKRNSATATASDRHHKLSGSKSWRYQKVKYTHRIHVRHVYPTLGQCLIGKLGGLKKTFVPNGNPSWDVHLQNSLTGKYSILLIFSSPEAVLKECFPKKILVHTTAAWTLRQKFQLKKKHLQSKNNFCLKKKNTQLRTPQNKQLPPTQDCKILWSCCFFAS